MRSALLALLLCPSLVSAAEPRDAAVKVTGPGFSGSGTVVGRDGDRCLVLTNRHVCPKPTAGLAVHHGGKEYPAEWVRADPADDLALLAVAADLPAAELADAPPAAGTVLQQWGYPKAGPQTPRSGPAVGPVRVTDHTVDAELEVWVSDFAPEAGESGSGLFDPSGRLVAVTFARTQDDQCHAVPVGRVRTFLRARPAALSRGMDAADAADADAPPPPGPPPGPTYEWRRIPGAGGDYGGYGWVEKKGR